jgi:rod shape-determining protein MreC
VPPNSTGLMTFLDLRTADLAHPTTPRAPEAPQVMQAFVARHKGLLALVGVLIAQLLLLSFQINRNRNVRLIKFWTVSAFAPFERSLKGITDASAQAWRTYSRLWKAQQENEELRAQLLLARAQIQQLSQQVAETERLRALLDLRARQPFQTLAAEVIASSPGGTSNALLIDKGGDAGLVPDMAVIAPEGVVGKILAVFPHTAQVLLITDPASGAGSMLAQSHIQGVLKGTGGNLCHLDYVMNEESVAPGEAVVTSGLDQIYPKGLPLGTVVRVEEGNIYKEITVKPAAALDRLESVLVVLKPTPSEPEARNLRLRPYTR